MTCAHRPEPELGYVAWHLDAQERHKRGERQRKCENCGKFIWGSFWGPADWPTKDKPVCIVGRVFNQKGKAR